MATIDDIIREQRAQRGDRFWEAPEPARPTVDDQTHPVYTRTMRFNRLDAARVHGRIASWMIRDGAEELVESSVLARSYLKASEQIIGSWDVSGEAHMFHRIAQIGACDHEAHTRVKSAVREYARLIKSSLAEMRARRDDRIVCSEMRAQADHASHEYVVVRDELLARGARAPRLAERRVERFMAEQQIIAQLRGQIDTLIGRYRRFDRAEQPHEELESVLRSASRRGLLASCRSVRYYEGVKELALLTKEVKLLVRDPARALAERDRLRERIAEAEHESSWIARIDEKAPVEELRRLVADGSYTLPGAEASLFAAPELEHGYRLIEQLKKSAQEKTAKLRSRLSERLDRFMDLPRPTTIEGVVEAIEGYDINTLRAITKRLEVLGNTEHAEQMQTQIEEHYALLFDAQEVYEHLDAQRGRLSQLEREMVSDDLSPDKAQRLVALYEERPPALKYKPLEREYLERRKDLKQALDASVHQAIDRADAMLVDRESYRPDFVLAIYQRLQSVRDLGERVEKARAAVRHSRPAPAYDGKVASLPLRMLKIGEPENAAYLTLHDVLAGRHGERSWAARLARAHDEIERMPIKTSHDVTYCQQVLDAIGDAIAKPDPFFEISRAKQLYKRLNERVSSYFGRLPQQ